MSLKSLVIAFSPEGTTDVRFLSSIIRRTAEDLLTRHGVQQLEVLDPIPFFRTKGDGTTGAERLLKVAVKTHGYHCLIVHADADAASPQAALTQRLAPGEALIRAQTVAQQQLVWLVPVTMTEAWMLADTALLQDALATDLEVIRDLGLPRPNRAEKVAYPKDELLQAIQTTQAALTPRQRQPSHELMADLYAQLDDIPLTSLRRLPSFLKFETDFLAVLIALGFAQQ